MIRVLITGGSGQLGQSFGSIEKYVISMGIELIILDRAELDITSKDSIMNALEVYQPDFIVNAAAYTNVDKAEEEPETAKIINCIAPKLLATECSKRGKVMIQISTDYVFDGTKVGGYVEEDETCPIGVYGATKLQGEREVLSINSSNIVIRTSWVFSEYGNNFLKTMLRLGKERETLGIVSDQYGAPTYAPHIALVIIELVKKFERIEGGIYNFAGNENVSWYDFAESIFKELREQKVTTHTPTLKKLKTSEFPTLATRPKNSYLLSKKISKEIGVNLKNDYQLGIKKAIGNISTQSL